MCLLDSHDATGKQGGLQARMAGDYQMPLRRLDDEIQDAVSAPVADCATASFTSHISLPLERPPR